jgi:hypothetical protein
LFLVNRFFGVKMMKWVLAMTLFAGSQYAVGAGVPVIPIPAVPAKVSSIGFSASTYHRRVEPRSEGETEPARKAARRIHRKVAPVVATRAVVQLKAASPVGRRVPLKKGDMTVAKMVKSDPPKSRSKGRKKRLGR